MDSVQDTEETDIGHTYLESLLFFHQFQLFARQTFDSVSYILQTWNVLGTDKPEHCSHVWSEISSINFTWLGFGQINSTYYDSWMLYSFASKFGSSVLTESTNNTAEFHAVLPLGDATLRKWKLLNTNHYCSQTAIARNMVPLWKSQAELAHFTMQTALLVSLIIYKLLDG